MIAEHRRRNVFRDWDIARTLGVWIVSPYSSDLLKLEGNKPIKASTPEQFQEALKKYGIN